MERDDEGRNSPTGEYAQRLRNIKERDDARNDELELRENARNRQLAHEKEGRSEAMRTLMAEAEKMPRELFERLPALNDWDTQKTVVEHGIPDPEDSPNPLLFRDASQTPLQDSTDRAWGTTLSQAVARAAREDERKAKLTGQDTMRETLADRMKREAKEQGTDLSRTVSPEQKHDLGIDRSRL